MSDTPQLYREDLEAALAEINCYLFEIFLAMRQVDELKRDVAKQLRAADKPTVSLMVEVQQIKRLEVKIQSVRAKLYCNRNTLLRYLKQCSEDNSLL